MCKENMSEKALLPTKCIFATNVPSKGAQIHSATRPFNQNLISGNCQHSKTLEKHENKEKLFELNGTLFVLS